MDVELIQTKPLYLDQSQHEVSQCTTHFMGGEIIWITMHVTSQMIFQKLLGNCNFRHLQIDATITIDRCCSAAQSTDIMNRLVEYSCLNLSKDAMAIIMTSS